MATTELVGLLLAECEPVQTFGKLKRLKRDAVVSLGLDFIPLESAHTA